MDRINWETLPQNILVDIFSYLSMNQRLRCSTVCKWWHECLDHPKLWSRFMFKFDTNIDDEGKAIKCIESYCEIGRLSEVEIFINPKQSVSRDRAVKVMEELRSSPRKKLQKFSFHFSAYNPLLFDGTEILSAMKRLFATEPITWGGVCHVTTVDLTRCNLSLDDEFVAILAANHPYLRVLRMQNTCLVDNVTSHGLLQLVSGCRKLKELDTFYHSIDDRVITELSTDFRSKLEKLSLICNALDKFHNPVQIETWRKFANSNSEAEVSIDILQTAPRNVIAAILCPGIPLVDLKLSVYGWRNEELALIRENYKETLKRLTLHNDLEGTISPPPGFETALLNLIAECDHLEEISCAYVMSPETVETVQANGKVKRYSLHLFRETGNEKVSSSGSS